MYRFNALLTDSRSKIVKKADYYNLEVQRIGEQTISDGKIQENISNSCSDDIWLLLYLLFMIWPFSEEHFRTYRARNCKRLRRPGIDLESIPPAYVAVAAGTSNRVVLARQAT